MWTAAKLVHKAGDVDRACALLERETEHLDEGSVSDRVREKWQPWVIFQLGTWRYKQRRYDEALDWFNAFEQLPRRGEAAKKWPAVLLQRSYVWNALGLPDRAGASIDEALAVYQKAWSEQPNEATGRALVQARRTHVLHLKAQGEHRSAVALAEHYLEDRTPYEGDDEELYSLQIYRATSLLEVEQENEDLPRRASSILEEILQHEVVPRARRFHGYVKLARSALFRDDYEEATASLALARDVAGLDWSDIDETTERFAEDMIALEVDLALGRGDSPGQLQPWVVRIDAVLDSMIERWAATPPRPGGLGFLLEADRRQITSARIGLDLALEPEGAAEAGLEQVLRLQAMSTLARREAVPVPSLTELQQALLEPGRGMLVYLPADGTSRLFTIDHESVHAHELVEADLITRARVDYFSHLVAQHGSAIPRDLLVAEERKLARALAEELLPTDVAARVHAWSQVTIVGTDLLGPTPFEWLPLGEERYLGAKRAVSYLPSVPWAVHHAGQPHRASGDRDLVLAVADQPAIAAKKRWDSAVALPFDGDVQSKLASPYGERVHVLSGAETTLGGLAEVGPASGRVLQFLGHAIHDSNRERPTGLVFAGDAAGSVAWCEDVEGWDAPELVLLSACRSAYGPMRRGDPGASAMAGAWMAQGARAVITCRDELTFDQAVDASALVHRDLAASASPAEALRTVRKAAIAADPDGAPLDAPLWQVVGLGHEPVFDTPRETAAVASDEPPTRNWFAWAALAAVAMLAIALWRRRS